MAYKNNFDAAAVLTISGPKMPRFYSGKRAFSQCGLTRDFTIQPDEKDPELYAISAVAEKIRVWQQVRVLFQLLRQSRAGASEEIRETLDRVTAYLLTVLHADQVLTVFLAVRRVRANHKHTRKAILKYVLDHPRIEDMAVRRRASVVDCLEHALGRNTARACAKMILDTQGTSASLRRNLLRFASNPERARAMMRLLYGGAGHPVMKGSPYTVLHKDYDQEETSGPNRRRPKTITATNRGDIAATLVHIYRGGTNPELREAVDRYVHDAASQLPRFDGKVALVLDASASTRGYGEREFSCILTICGPAAGPRKMLPTTEGLPGWGFQ